MSELLNSLKQKDNVTETENGAAALKSTQSALVDLFGSIGAYRKRSDQDIEAAFVKAFAEDKLLATKMAFYARDIRFGGLGERRTVRIALIFLAKVYPDILKKNIENIPHFGRWDDLYVLIGTAAEADMWALISKQWKEDSTNMAAGKPISVMAKWLKSINTSSFQSRKLGRATCKALGLTEKQYRKGLSAMRQYIDVVERKMSAGIWSQIEYPGVPSRAMTIYRKAFAKHDTEGFTAFIGKVEKGEEKINASTLFPYDILERMGIRTYGNYLSVVNHDKVLEEQWKALPNYVEGEQNVLVMADTSGSMNGRPMATSVGLAMYFAERNKGVWKDIFMTFSSKPSLVQLKGKTIYEKIQSVPSIVDNTNLEAAFKLVLDAALENNLSQADMPKSLVVISDMQFDSATYIGGGFGYGRAAANNWTFYDSMKQMYIDHGYEMPNVIFWNVDSRQDTFQVTSDYKGVQLASGQSASVFKSILKNIGLTPYEAMVNTLNNPVYDCVII